MKRGVLLISVAALFSGIPLAARYFGFLDLTEDGLKYFGLIVLALAAFGFFLGGVIQDRIRTGRLFNWTMVGLLAFLGAALLSLMLSE